MIPPIISSNKCTKRSQVSVYIVIGLLFLVIIGLVISFARLRTPAPSVPEQIQPVVTFVEQCIREVALPGISLLALQGGQIYPRQLSVHFNATDIAYGNYRGNNTLVSKETIQEQLGTYISYALLDCINTFEQFATQGWNISYTPHITSTVTVAQDHVTVAVKFPVRAQGVLLEDFSVEMATPLGYLYDAAKYINARTIVEPNLIDLTSLAELGDVAIIPVTKDTLAYSITADNLVFMFAVMPALNQRPQLHLQDAYELSIGQQFTLQIPYEDDNPFSELSFAADSAMITIEKDSLSHNATLVFTPEIAGEFPVTITITDALHQTDEKRVRFIVHD